MTSFISSSSGLFFSLLPFLSKERRLGRRNQDPSIQDTHSICVLTRSRSKAQSIFPGKKVRVLTCVCKVFIWVYAICWSQNGALIS